MRFPEFNYEWNNYSLEELTKVNQGLQIAIKDRYLEDGTNRYFYITNEFLKENSEKKYYIENPSKSVICTNEDILMTRTGNTGTVVTGVSGAFHNNFFKIKYDKKRLDKNFLYYLLTSNKLQHHILRLAGSSTIPDLNHRDFYSIKISIPNLVEQNKISAFISSIDVKLNLLKDKKNHYVKFKQYLLQNLFPQNGSNAPKLRFIEEIYYKRQNVSDFLIESEIDAIDNINKRLTVKLNLKGVYKREIKPNEKEGATKQYKRKAGQFIYGKQNLFKGAFGIIPSELDGFLSSKDLPSFDFKDNINSKWFYYYFSRSNFYKHLENLSNGTGSKRISPEEFLKIQINVPQSIEEQEKIASFLSFVDKKIDLLDQEIELVEEYKKGLLQKMFI